MRFAKRQAINPNFKDILSYLEWYQKTRQHKNVNMFLYKNDSYLITKYEYEQLMYQLARRHRGCG
jgi:hypothetical protein